MNTVTIYDKNGATKAVVQPIEGSQQICEIMAIDAVRLIFSLAVFRDFIPGDFIKVFSKNYTLNTPSTFKKIAGRNYEYSLDFESDTQNLGKVLYLFLDRYKRFTESEFSFTGTAKAFLDLLILNLNRVYPNFDYKIGIVVESTEKTIDFSGNNCLEVLATLSSKFETEWVIDGNKISLYKKQVNTGIVIGYGKGNGLYSLTKTPQTNANPITRIYGFGSDRNIGNNYRLGAKRLRMPNGLYLEKNTSVFGIIEIRKVFDDIFPRREGIVSAVTSPFIFTDADLDFNVTTQLMPGVTAKVTFNTGQLAGDTFEVENYNNATKTFTIKKNTDEQTVDIPSVLLTPAIGDKYVITDILMPNKYITNAEAELTQAVQKLLDEKAGYAPIVLSVVCDPINFRNTGKKVVLGSLLTVNEPSVNINKTVRVIKFTRSLRDESAYAIDLADTVKENYLTKIVNA